MLKQILSHRLNFSFQLFFILIVFAFTIGCISRTVRFNDPIYPDRWRSVENKSAREIPQEDPVCFSNIQKMNLYVGEVKNRYKIDGRLFINKDDFVGFFYDSHIPGYYHKILRKASGKNVSLAPFSRYGTRPEELQDAANFFLDVKTKYGTNEGRAWLSMLTLGLIPWDQNYDIKLSFYYYNPRIEKYQMISSCSFREKKRFWLINAFRFWHRDDEDKLMEEAVKKLIVPLDKKVI